MLTTQPTNFKENTLRKIPFICIAIQSCQLPQKNPFPSSPALHVHSKEKSIPPALLFNPAPHSMENIPFHLPCNLVLLCMYTPRKISFHLRCNLILLYPPWKIPFLLDWYLIRSPFHLRCCIVIHSSCKVSFLLLSGGALALVLCQRPMNGLLQIHCEVFVEYISLAQGFS